MFYKDFEVLGAASFNTISSRINDNILINDNLIITGNITIGGSSFTTKVDDVVNPKLTNCLQYDTALSGPVAKILNLSGLSLFQIDGFNNAMEGRSSLMKFDINGITAGYSSFTVLIDRLASSHIWASDRHYMPSQLQHKFTRTTRKPIS